MDTIARLSDSIFVFQNASFLYYSYLLKTCNFSLNLYARELHWTEIPECHISPIMS